MKKVKVTILICLLFSEVLAESSSWESMKHAYLLEKGSIAFGILEYPLNFGIYDRLNIFITPVIAPFVKVIGGGFRLKFFENDSMYLSETVASLHNIEFNETLVGTKPILSVKLKRIILSAGGLLGLVHRNKRISYDYGISYMLETQVFKQLAFALDGEIGNSWNYLSPYLVLISDFIQLNAGINVEDALEKPELLIRFDIVLKFKVLQ